MMEEGIFMAVFLFYFTGVLAVGGLVAFLCGLD